MAKPGSQAAALIGSGLAHDLSRAGRGKTLDEQRIALETKLGMRCGGCKRRMDSGYEFIVFAVVEVKGAGDKLAAPRQYACAREDCGYRDKVAKHANAMRAITPWMYVDELRGEKIAGALDPALELDPERMARALGERAKVDEFLDRAQEMVDSGAADAAFEEGLAEGLPDGVKRVDVEPVDSEN